MVFKKIFLFIFLCLFSFSAFAESDKSPYVYIAPGGSLMQGYGDLFDAGYNLRIGYHFKEDWTIEGKFNVIKGGAFRDFAGYGFDLDGKYFISGSFLVSAGLGASLIRYTDGGIFDDVATFGTGPTPVNFVNETLAFDAHASIGNQFTYKTFLTFGFDWIGIRAPFAQKITKRSSTATYEEKTTPGIPFMQIYLGFRF